MAILVLLAAAVVVAPSTGVGAEHPDDAVRIAARKLTGGEIELGLQQRQAEDSWSEQLLPSERLFPTTAATGRWLESSPLTVRVAATDDGAPTDVAVRIAARKLTSGKVEVALQTMDTDDTWGSRQLPAQRLFPTTATVGRWLVSSAVAVTAARPTAAEGATQTAERYTAVDAGAYQACTVDGGGAIACWGETPFAGGEDPPDGQFTAVSVGANHACGLRTDGTVACWSLNLFGVFSGKTEPPAGRFTALSTAPSGKHSCGLRADGTIACWGSNGWLQTTAPSGTFSAVSAGTVASCGLRADGAVECWGSLGVGPDRVPDGRFTAMSVGFFVACGLRADGTIACWGPSAESVGDPPDGHFTAVTVGGTSGEHACALRAEGTVACWGLESSGQADPPDGLFTAVAAGGDFSCGLRADGTLECWGANAGRGVDLPG